MRTRRYLLVAALIVAVLVTGSAVVALDDPPAMPNWANADGTVDVDVMPIRMRVLDSEGNYKRDANGDIVTVPTFPPLPDGPLTEE